MKKKQLTAIATILLSGTLFLALAGCSDDSGSDTTADKTSSAASTASSSETAVATPTPTPVPDPQMALRLEFSGDGSEMKADIVGNAEAETEVCEAQFFIYVTRDDKTVDMYSSTRFDKDTEVTLTVHQIDNAPYIFDGWEGDASGTATSITVKMDADKTIKVKCKKNFTENVALEATGSCTTALTGSADWVIDNLFDGMFYFKGFSTNVIPSVNTEEDASIVEFATPVEIIADLGAAKAFNTLTLVPRNTDHAFTLEDTNVNFPLEFTVSVSADGTTYTDVQTFTDGTDPANMAVSYALGDQTAQYVKLSVTKVSGPATDESVPVAYRVQLFEFMLTDNAAAAE